MDLCFPSRGWTLGALRGGPLPAYDDAGCGGTFRNELGHGQERSPLPDGGVGSGERRGGLCGEWQGGRGVSAVLEAHAGIVVPDRGGGGGHVAVLHGGGAPEPPPGGAGV